MVFKLLELSRPIFRDVFFSSCVSDVAKLQKSASLKALCELPQLFVLNYYSQHLWIGKKEMIFKRYIQKSDTYVYRYLSVDIFITFIFIPCWMVL